MIIITCVIPHETVVESGDSVENWGMQSHCLPILEASYNLYEEEKGYVARDQLLYAL